ncbi:MAG: DUF4369 domain-containing protein [Muribaculaceae bacterium]|nr:DUF4369 domain-containing protein [Muribaculaceae bacterium]
MKLCILHFSLLMMIAAAVAMLTGCVDNLDKSHFRVECRISPELGTDSVTLLLLLEDYNSVYRVATVARDSKSEAFVFEGIVEEPAVACLKFSNDTTPMMFVIEPGLTKIDISSNGLVISGGDANHEYMTYLKARKALTDEKQKLHQEYLGQVAPDSTIDDALERQYFARDSLLTDSIEHITVDAINRRNAASKIIFERYVNTLSRKNLQNIHKK